MTCDCASCFRAGFEGGAEGRAATASYPILTVAYVPAHGALHDRRTLTGRG